MSPEVEKNFIIRKSIHDFLSNFHFILFQSPYMTSYLTSIDTISLSSRPVLEILPVKILNPKQNGGFWPKGHESIFSIIVKVPPCSKRRLLRYSGWKSVQPFRMYRAQDRRKLKKEKNTTLICWVYVPQSTKLFSKPKFARLFRSMT